MGNSIGLTTLLRRVSSRSRVAILIALAAAIAFASGCSAESAKIPSLKPPATYSAADAEKYGIGTHARCGPGEYDGNAIAVDPHTGKAHERGLDLIVEKTGEEMIITVSYDGTTGVDAFLVGDTSDPQNEQWFVVPAPSDEQHDSQFRLVAKEVSLGTASSLTTVSVCPTS